jgi:hypothetical protein
MLKSSSITHSAGDEGGSYGRAVRSNAVLFQVAGSVQNLRTLVDEDGVSNFHLKIDQYPLVLSKSDDN